MSPLSVLPYLGIFLCAATLEVGWILAVRFVADDDPRLVVVNAMAMQAISYAATLILVTDRPSMVAGVLGAGVGAWIGMRIPRKSGRRRKNSDSTPADVL